jgi:hypothetical protein
MTKLERTRVLHGMLWGMIATPIAAIIPLGAMALSLWPAPSSVTTAVLHHLLGITGPGAYVLAAIAQLLYGGAWGAFLAFATGPIDPPLLVRPSALSIGLGVGFFRAFLGSLSGLLYAGWGAFGVLTSPLIAVGILATDLLFGAMVAILLTREESGRLTLPFTKLRVDPA